MHATWDERRELLLDGSDLSIRCCRRSALEDPDAAVWILARDFHAIGKDARPVRAARAFAIAFGGAALDERVDDFLNILPHQR